MRLANNNFIFIFTIETKRVGVFFFGDIYFFGGMKIVKCIAEETKTLRIFWGGLKGKIVLG